MGPAEGVIILVIVLVLFGPTLVAFFMGYSLGKKRASQPASSHEVPKASQDAEPSAPTGTGPTQATDTDSGSDSGEEQQR